MIVLLAALVLLLPAAITAAPAPASLRACTAPGSVEAAECGTIDVFEDRERAQGRKIPISFLVYRAKAASPAGDPLFIIPGGPGQSSTEFAGLLLPELEFIRASRDLVFVDQRGTGGSNALHCPLGGTLDEILQSIAVGVDADLRAVRACRTALERRADLRLYTTDLAADDLDDVRAALGYTRINLFGVSYGTRAALVYMRRHPTRVRAAILRATGSVDLRLPLTINTDAHRALTRLFAACAADRECGSAFADPATDVARTLAQLRKAPRALTVADPRTGVPSRVRITADVFATGLFFMLFVTDWSRHLPHVAHQAARGNFEPFAAITIPAMVGSALPVHWGMRRSVLCAEDVAGLTAKEIAAAAQGTFAGADADLGLLKACGEWPVRTMPTDYDDPIASDVPVLAISGEEDPVLPPARAEAALRHLPNARHVIVPGVAHGPNFPGCTPELTARFLETGSAKGLDLTCAMQGQRPAFTLPGRQLPAVGVDLVGRHD